MKNSAGFKQHMNQNGLKLLSFNEEGEKSDEEPGTTEKTQIGDDVQDC
jgi:hypothetical protein